MTQPYIAYVLTMKPALKLPDLLILLALILSMPSDASAESPPINSLKSRQHQLESLLTELKQASQHRQQTNDRLKQLKHKIDCNWTLIRAYEVCGQLYGEKPDKHLTCSSMARDDAQKCLSTQKTE